MKQIFRIIHSFSLFFFSFLVLPLYCYQPISLHPHAHMLSHVTPWTAAHQAPLSMDFSRQEYWSGLPFPSPSLYFLFVLSGGDNLSVVAEFYRILYNTLEKSSKHGYFSNDSGR